MAETALRTIQIAGPTEPVVVTADASLMEVISRAAADPNTDVEKLERLMAMYERITAGRSKAAYASAFSAMQAELPSIERNGRITIKAKDSEKVIQSTPYALWQDINEAIKPVLVKHGFGLSFRVSREADRVVVTGVLSHSGGHSEETTMSLPLDSTGSKNNVQAAGSSVSYGKRYTASALLNITSHDIEKDDDGEAAGAGPTINESDLADLRALMTEVKADQAKFLEYLKVQSLDTIPAKDVKRAFAALNAKRRKS